MSSQLDPVPSAQPTPTFDVVRVSLTAADLIDNLTTDWGADLVASVVLTSLSPATTMGQMWQVSLADRIPSLRIRTLRALGEVSRIVAEQLAIREIATEIE